MRTGRFQPYGTYHPNEYGNAEAGPSSLVAQPIPHLGLPTPQPSGGISETAADAATKQTKTEELEVTVSNFYCSHILRVIEWSFGVRCPSGPGSPGGKDHHAAPAWGSRGLPISCATGYGGKKGSREFRALMWPWLVSMYLML